MDSKLIINKVKNFITGSPKMLAEHAFLGFIILFFITALFGEFLFYTYYISIEKTELQSAKKEIEIKEKTRQELLEYWRERDEIFKSADTKQFPNIFSSINREQNAQQETQQEPSSQ